MSDQWVAVDGYITNLFARDPASEAALEASRAAGLPDISVTPAQGKLLYLFARVQSARAILEIGTLGGYSTIWMARALPEGGRLVTLEIEPKHGELAKQNIERAGLAGLVEIRIGPALDTLAQLTGPFDLIFIDADKPSYPEYLTWALKLARRGTLIVADNAIRHGDIINASSDDPRVIGMRRFLEQLAAEPRLTATVIQTVGGKGYDGFALASVIA